MAIELLRSFLQQATATGSKSTVLTDLRWLAGILLSAMLIGFTVSAPSWFTIAMMICLGADLVIYFCAYIYFGLKNPDALRTENYTLSKLAIEQSLKGDSITGLLVEDPKGRSAQLLSPTTDKEGE